MLDEAHARAGANSKSLTGAGRCCIQGRQLERWEITMSTISTFYPGDDVMAGVAAVTAILLLTAVSLAVALLLPHRPTTRHTLLLSALVCSLLTPLVAVALRGWDISTLVWHVAPAERPATVPIAAGPPRYIIATAPPVQSGLTPRERARRATAAPRRSMPVLEPPATSMPVMPAPPIDSAIVIRDDDPSSWQPAAPPLVAPAGSFTAPLAQPAPLQRGQTSLKGVAQITEMSVMTGEQN